VCFTRKGRPALHPPKLDKQMSKAVGLRARMLLPPFRSRSAHVVSLWPVRDEYDREHSSDQSRPRTVDRPTKFFSFEPHVETLVEGGWHPVASLLTSSFRAPDTRQLCSSSQKACCRIRHRYRPLGHCDNSANTVGPNHRRRQAICPNIFR
jgi:hypothetical protein